MTEKLKAGFRVIKSKKCMIEAAALHILWAVYAFFASRFEVFGSVAPFGFSAVAGADIKFVPAAVIGAAAGYFIPVSESQSGFPYLAALCAIAAVRMILNGAAGIKGTPLLNSLSGALIPTIVFCAVSAAADTGFKDAVLLGVLSGLCTFAVSVFARETEDEIDGLNSSGLVSFAITFSVLAMGLSGYFIGNLSVGRILNSVFLLIVSHYGGTESGAVCGISASLLMMMSDTANPFLIMYPVSSMICGIAARKNRVSTALIFVGVSAVFFVISGGTLNALPPLIESFFASALFLIIPERACFKVGSIFTPPAENEGPYGIKGALLLRLRDASNALKGVSVTVEKVAGELSRINTPEHSEVIARIKKEACSGCRCEGSCWEASREKTVDAVRKMGSFVTNGDALIMPDELRERCIRREKMEDSVKTSFYDFMLRIDAESRMRDVRETVCDQFDGISYMLSDLAEEFARGEKYDIKSASVLSKSLKNMGLKVSECGCKTDRFGRMSAEIRIRNCKAKISRMRILNAVENALGREFEPPEITHIGNDINIKIFERPDYTVLTGVAQVCSDSSAVCGDAYNIFFDGNGRFIAVLSDGMGTGGRAAVDSAMASGLMSELIKAGFGFDSSLKILNSSMLFKSTDESLATVDITCVDLFSGHTTLLKAGAAPTVVLRSGRTGRAESNSLPAGILHDTAFDRADITVKEGDLVVMMSDGVTYSGTDWICDELEYFDGDLQRLAEKIANKAAKMRDDGHTDDITVITARLDKAV